MIQKIYSKMHSVLCTNTHHNVTDLVNHGMVKNTKTWVSWKRMITFLWNKKILNLCLRWHILRSYRFLAEVTFKVCVRYFLSSFYFPPNYSPAKTMKNNLFHLKSSFCFTLFKFLYFRLPLFFSPSAIALEVDLR